MDQIITDYLQNAEAVLKAAAGEEKALKLAAQIIADAYAAEHKIYIFGCTHSAILAEDVFYRAGAPAFWRPLWGPGMSITTTPGFLTSAVEHSEEIGNESYAVHRWQRETFLFSPRLPARTVRRSLSRTPH